MEVLVRVPVPHVLEHEDQFDVCHTGQGTYAAGLVAGGQYPSATTPPDEFLHCTTTGMRPFEPQAVYVEFPV